MSAYTKVPMKRLQPLVKEWLKRPGNTQRGLSERAGVPERRIYEIKRGYGESIRDGRSYVYHNVEFTTADALLSAMDMENEWYISLYDLYFADDAA